MSFGKSSVHIDKGLTNFAISFVQDQKGLIADKVCPPVEVGKETDKFWLFDRGNWRTREDLRAAGSEANRSQMPLLSTSTYAIEEHSLFDVVSTREMEEADDPLMPKQDVTSSILEQLLINKEKNVADVMFVTAAVANYTSLATGSQWGYTSSTTPIADVDTGSYAVQVEIGKKPNQGFLGAEVWKVLKNHGEILDRIKYTQTGIITEDLVASVFDLDNITVGRAIRMTTAEGVSETVSYIWGKSLLLSYVTPRPSKRTISHAYQFVKKGSNVKVESWYEKKVRGDQIEGSLMYDPKVVSTLAGYTIFGAVA